MATEDLKGIFENYLSHYFEEYTKLLNMVPHSPKSVFSNDLLYKEQYPHSLLNDDTTDDEDDDDDYEECPYCQAIILQGAIDFLTSIFKCECCKRFFHQSCVQKAKYTMFKKKTSTNRWICNNCILGNGFYGFQMGSKQYILQNFINECEEDTSKSIDQLEKEFWEKVNDNSISNNPSSLIMYGADIHNSEQISGFPLSNHALEKGSSKYVSHPMNLVNLPNALGSLLPLLSNKTISGMTIPWIYVGSTFSTFCWHMEDQYTLSANYQHEGASKIWYSIPASSCEPFQKLLHSMTPDLFIKQQDLIHQLVSLVSPYDLPKSINCYKAIQNPNEYIITFPKCFHSGFNTGYNLNEAVNFTTPFWLPFGVEAVDDYKLTQRKCAFDVNELLLNLIKYMNKKGGNKQDISHVLITSCITYLRSLVFREKSLLKELRVSLPENWFTPLIKMENELVDGYEDENEDEEYIYLSLIHI